jgi:hypothetical protein
MTTLSDLITLTNITRKQINNRTLPLSKRYPNLIKGGGKGKIGKYFIHPLLTRYLTHHKLYTSQEIIEQLEDIQSNYLKRYSNIDTIETFNQIPWKFFCCYHPARNLNAQALLNLIPLEEGDIVYYSIHTDNRDKEHLHFVTTHPNQNRLKNKKNQPKDIPMVEPFKMELSEGCYHYFRDMGLFRGGQRITEWGYIMGFNDRKGIKQVVLWRC